MLTECYNEGKKLNNVKMIIFYKKNYQNICIL